jgi:hypothetical protein
MSVAVVTSPNPPGLARQATLRVLGVLAVLGLTAVVTFAAIAPSTASLINYLAKYSPDRLADGRVWTLPMSAFLVGHPHMIGPTTFFIVLIFLPYALWRGLVRAGIVAMSGHVVSTLVVAAVVLPASAMGLSEATSIARSLDYGASAALAACAGGLAVALARRVRPLGVLVLVSVVGWFVYSLVTIRQTMSNVADVEHLVGLGTGMAVEWWFERHREPSTAVARAADEGA